MFALDDAVVILLELRGVGEEDGQGVAGVGAGVDVLGDDRDQGIAGLLEGKGDGDEGELRAVALAGLLEEGIFAAAVGAGVIEHDYDLVLGAG